MSTRARRIADALLRWQRLIGVFLLLLILVATAFTTRVEFDNALEIWFPRGNPELLTYQHFSARYPADETVLLAVFADDVFSASVLDAIAQVAAAAASGPHVHRVHALTDPQFQPPDALQPDIGLKPWILGNSVANGLLVASDARAAAVLVELERAGNTVAGKQALVGYLEKMLARVGQATGTIWQMSGTPVLDVRVLEANRQDLQRLVPLAAVLLLVAGGLLLGNPWLGLLPVATVLLAATCTYGIMGALGLQATLLSTALVPLLLAVGSADAIHMITAVRQAHAAGAELPQAVRDSLARLLVPCFFTSATTAAGLCALLASTLNPIREFGLVAAGGVLFAFLFSITLLPYLLLRLPSRLFTGGRGDALASGVTVLAMRLATWPRVGCTGVVLALLLAALAIAQLGQLRASVDPLAWLDPSDPFRRTTEHIDAAFDGSASLEFLVSAGGASLRDLALLRELDEFERWLESATPVSRAISAVDLLMEATRQARQAPPGEQALPRARLVAELLYAELEARGDLDGWVTDDFTSLRLTARVPLSLVIDLAAELERIDTEIAMRFADSALVVQPTGYARLVVAMEGDLLAAQAQSLTAAFLVVVLLLGLLLRSAWLGLCAILPSVVPVLVGLGMLSLSGVALDPGTVMAGAVTLGLVVDNTVHFLVGFRERLAAGDVVDAALRSTQARLGTPLLSTSAMVTLGFAALLPASVAPTARFAVLACGIVLLALVTVLTLLPALLRLAPTRVIASLQR